MNRVLVPILILLVLFPIIANSAAIQLPQSGQTNAYSATDDGDLRTGKPWPNLRFSNNGDQTVTDHLTGLIWTKNANLIKDRDPGFDNSKGDGMVSWQHALDYIHKLNQEKYLGYNDWRLPNLNELASLVNQGQANAGTWLNRQGFAGVRPQTYWTSSTNVLSTATAWTIGMADGPLNYLKKSRNGYVWPVRGGRSEATAVSGINLPKTGQAACFDTNGVAISCAGTGQDGELQIGATWPQPRFSDNGDQTVTDNLTGLIWTRDANLMITRDSFFDNDGRNSDGAVTWQGALDYVKTLNREEYLGFSDWRLPNRIELASVMNYVETNPFAWLNWQGIFNVQNNYWTSATVASTTGNAWNVHATGAILGAKKSVHRNKSHLWPVRSGLLMDEKIDGSTAIAPSNAPVDTFPVKSGNSESGSMVLSGTSETSLLKVTTSVLPDQSTDAIGAKSTQDLTITTYMLVAITTTSLPAGTVNEPYNQALTAIGGKIPYTWSLATGNLPVGLKLDAAGYITGMPTTIGNSTITIQATDINGNMTVMSYTIIINGPLTVTAVSPLPNTVDVMTGSVTATFSEPLNPATITNGSFTVSRKLKVIRIAAGGAHTVVLREDGTVAVWGDNSCGNSTIPQGLSGVVAIAAGGAHTVALKNDGTLVAWGYNSNGQTTIPAGLSNVVAIAAGDNHTVALKADGTVVAWGQNVSGQASVPAGLSGVMAIAAGPLHTVALKTDGSVVAWGYNGYGQTLVPSGLSGVVAVSAGYDHTIAVKSDGTIVAWGSNPYSPYSFPSGLTDVKGVAVGSGFEIALKRDATLLAWGWGMWAPLRLPVGLSNVIEIAAGVDHAIALKNDGTIVLWGRSNDYGQATVPVSISGVIAVVAGHTMVLKSDGSVTAWDTGQSTVPEGLSKVVAIAAGHAHSIALKDDGKVVAWGDSLSGQTRIPPELSDVVGVAASSYCSLALKGDGTVAAWGDSWVNQPNILSGLSGVVALAAGHFHAVALKNNGTVVAWGNNYSGEATVPAGLSGVIAVAAGEKHTVALKSDGTIAAWGSNDYSQCTVPAELSGVVAIAAGSAYTVALKADGTVVAWGYNSYGQTDVPPGLSGVIAVSARGRHTIALKADGTIVAWGKDTSGQSTTIPSSPYETPITGTVSWNPATLTATFVPNTYLPAQANLKAALSQGIKNLSGNRLPIDMIWNFTTATGPKISTTSLSEGFIGTAYNQTLSATGGKTPYTWSLSSGNLPAGLNLNSTSGVISGTASAAGSYGFTIRVTDANNMAASVTIALIITQPLNITTSAQLNSYIGIPYYNILTATGGLPPYTWSIINGSLPAGVALDPYSGIISGTSTAMNTNTITIQAMDSGISVASKVISLTVTGLGSIGGIVSDQVSGTPIQGAAVTLNLSYKESTNPNDKIYSCNDIPFSSADYSKVDSNDEIKFSCYGDYYSYFKIRNPFGVPDSFTMQWKGLNAYFDLYYGGEYLAQSFKPTKTGSLNRVSFYFSDYSARYGPSQCGPYVLLKSSLGGDRGVYLAYSAKMAVSASTTPGWYDFDFVTPATVTAGQEYILELQGNCPTWEFVSGNVDYDKAAWGSGVQYSDGQSFQRNGGIWKKLVNSLAFRTHVDAIPDIVTSLPIQREFIHGTASSAPYVYLNNVTTTRNESFDKDFANTTGTDNNSANFNFSKTVTNGSDYYDQNGWITAQLYSYADEAPATNLVTDQFGITFKRTLNTVTDANGAYFFQNLPDGNYTLTFEKTAYTTKSVSGTLSSGQALNLATDIQSTFSITTPSLPDGYFAGHYNATLGASGGTPPYTWSIISGVLPPYLVLNASSGTITGFIVNIGDYPLTLQVSDNNNVKATKILTMNLYMFAAITTTSLPPGTTNIAYNKILTAYGGKQPYTWSITTGSLPAGLVLNATGSISGTPTTIGISNFTIQAADVNGDKTTMSYTLSISAPIIVSTSSLPGGTTGNAYSQTLTATGGTMPYTWSIASGALPAGFSLNSTTGAITGIPTTTGDSTFIVRVKDNNNVTTTQTLTITVTLSPFIVRNLGDTGSVTVMEIIGNYDGKSPDGSQNDQPRKTVATEYFKNHPDKDFLVFFSTFDYAVPEADAQGFYTEVKNDTQGINRTLLNNSTQFGSAGMLQGTIDMGNITQLAANPYGPRLEETLTTLSHEMGHRWLAAVGFKNPDGTLNTSLIGKDNAHWSYLLDTKGSLMYGNGWKDNGDGTYTSVSKQNAFSPLDLYLMGMIPKEQVPPMLMIDNPAIDKTKLPHLGDTITGASKIVTIDDIIAVEGERIPNTSASQKQFNVGFVLLTRSGDNATAATQAIETMRKAWAGRFVELTQGKGSVANIPASLEIAIDSPLNGATITGPDVNVSGTVINTSGAETGVTVNGIPATVTGNRFIANHVPLIEGANSLEVKATDANGLTSTTTRSVTASPGNYIRISSNIESGTAPLEITLRIDGTFPVDGSTIRYSGASTVEPIEAANPEHYGFRITADGAYEFTAEVVGPDGQTYRDTVTITVISQTKLENLLNGKWDGINGKIAQNDLEGALQYIRSSAQSYHRELFTALGNDFPQLSVGTPPLEFVYATDDMAKCRVFQQEIVMGESVTVGYPVYFEKEDGIWRLKQY